VEVLKSLKVNTASRKQISSNANLSKVDQGSVVVEIYIFAFIFLVTTIIEGGW